MSTNSVGAIAASIQKLCADKFRNIYSPDNFWIKLFFLLSGTAVTTLLSLVLTSTYTILLSGPSIIFGFLAWIYLLFQYDLLQKIWVHTSYKQSGVAVIFTVATSYLFMKHFTISLNELITKADPYICSFLDYLGKSELTPTIAEKVAIASTLYSYHSVIMGVSVLALGIFSVFSLYHLWKYFFHITIPLLQEFYHGLSTYEKYFLVSLSIFSVVIIPIVYNLTNVFYLPVDFMGNYQLADIIYGMDTGRFIEYDSYVNIAAPDNSSHQFLFGLFTFPFGVFAHLVDCSLFFLPNTYYATIAIIQIILMGVSNILLSRLLALKSYNQLLFLCTGSIAFPYLVFSLSLEQYVFSMFWVILFIYAILKHRKYSEWYFIGAAGSLITSSILFPLLSPKINLRKYISIASVIICLSLISGKLAALLLLIPNSLSFGNAFSDVSTITFSERIIYYIDFISSCFLEPAMQFMWITPSWTNEYLEPIYRLIPVSSLNLLGVLILGVSILGFVLSYKEKFAKICFGWIIFSFILLCVVGFGIHELPLYSLYFAWAFLSLVYLAIKKLFGPHPKVQTAIFLCILMGMIYINIPGIYEIVLFGIDYYPIR